MVSLSLANVPWMNYVTTILWWTVYSILGFGMIGVAWFVMHVKKFRIKMTYWPLVGKGNDEMGIDKPQTNKFRWNKTKTHWVSLWPLFNKDEHEPFPQNCIYSGNNVYAFKVEQQYVPARIQLEKDKQAVSAVISPIPYYARRWQALQLKQNEMEFTKKSWWDENKTYLVAVVTVIVCCAVAALTVWWSYQFAGGNLQDFANAGQSWISQGIQNVAAQGAPA